MCLWLTVVYYPNILEAANMPWDMSDLKNRWVKMSSMVDRGYCLFSTHWFIVTLKSLILSFIFGTTTSGVAHSLFSTGSKMLSLAFCLVQLQKSVTVHKPYGIFLKTGYAHLNIRFVHLECSYILLEHSRYVVDSICWWSFQTWCNSAKSNLILLSKPHPSSKGLVLLQKWAMQVLSLASIFLIYCNLSSHLHLVSQIPL